MTTTTLPPPAAAPPAYSLARIAAKTIEWMAVGWIGFCGATALIAISSVHRLHPGDEVALKMAIGGGVLVWGGLALVGVVVAQLVAIALFLSAGKAVGRQASAREWAIAFLVAAVPNGLLAFGLIVRILQFGRLRNPGLTGSVWFVLQWLT